MVFAGILVAIMLRALGNCLAQATRLSHPRRAGWRRLHMLSLGVRGDKLGGFDPTEAFEQMSAEDALEFNVNRFLELDGIGDRANDLNDVYWEQCPCAGLRQPLYPRVVDRLPGPDCGRYFGAGFGIAGVGEYLATTKRRRGG